MPPRTVLERIAGLSVEFPRILGLGFVYRAPDGDLTVSFQWDRIEYSRIVESAGLEDQADDDDLQLPDRCGRSLSPQGIRAAARR